MSNKWILGARPKTLPAAVLPVVLGTAAASTEKFSFLSASLCLIIALALQVGVNYANDYSDGGFFTAGGVVTNLSKRWTRRGDLMATFDLEDLSSSIEVMVFPKSMAEHGHKLLDDSVLLVKGRLDSREDSPKLICSELETFETSNDDSGQSIQVSLPLERVDESTISEIKQLLSNYPGDVKVFFRLGDRQLLRLSDDFSVDPSNGLIAELRILLGVDSVSFI